ncbi:hypothetical protein QTN25_007147 [Entamoeba marina]
MTKDGISYSGIFLSPIKTMVCVYIVSTLFLIQSTTRFIAYFYMFVSSQTKVPQNNTQQISPWFQFTLAVLVDIPTIFIIFFMLTPFSKPTHFNMKAF